MKVLQCARSYSKSFMPTLIKGRPRNRHLTNTTQAVNLVHSVDQKITSVRRNIGQLQRRAFYALCYGASIQTAVKASGLSIRRVKVIAKQLPTL